MSFPDPTLLRLAALSSISTSSASSSSISGASFTYTDNSGAGGYIGVRATAPTGESITRIDSTFVPGATQVFSRGIATVSPPGITAIAIVKATPAEPTPLETPVAAPPLVETTFIEPFGLQDQLANPSSPEAEGLLGYYLLGTSGDDTLLSTSSKDILIGYGGADIFGLDEIGVSELAEADLIADFNFAEGDRLRLGPEISVSNIQFQGLDLDQNGSVESTVIRLGDIGPILAIAQNTIDTSEAIQLTLGAFV